MGVRASYNLHANFFSTSDRSYVKYCFDIDYKIVRPINSMRMTVMRALFVSVAVISCLVLFNAVAQAACTVPNKLTNGQTADAAQVMANFEALLTCSSPAGSAGALQYFTGSGLGGVGPLNDGQLVIGSTGSAPQAATLGAGPGITISNGPGSVVISAGGGGGGTLVNRYSASYPTSYSFDNVNPTLLTGTSITLPASAVSYTAFVSANCIYDAASQSSTLRFAIFLDGTVVWPQSSSPEISSFVNTDGDGYGVIAMVPITVPGDNATHTFGLYADVSHDTSARTISQSGISALVFSP